MAGSGGFRWTDAGDALESFGGSGLLWCVDEVFEYFVLRISWLITRLEDNSGVFLRCPYLSSDPQPAIECGYEIQIDDRGLDPETGRLGSPLHQTDAVYRLAPATKLLSRSPGEWNAFEITTRGPSIVVRLNGAEISRLEGGSRELRGHIGLQAYREGSVVQFCNLEIVHL
jgi:hypothetical protein